MFKKKKKKSVIIKVKGEEKECLLNLCQRLLESLHKGAHWRDWRHPVSRELMEKLETFRA